ncbi:hypothetical protein KEM54_003563 [Ascosphaera aggregata]|nr:hypothetical protein KEM54_003563 [Ascosphaera aggregata]
MSDTRLSSGSLPLGSFRTLARRLLWRMEYGKADKRWIAADPGVISLELLTVLFDGAAAVSVCYLIHKSVQTLETNPQLAARYRALLWFVAPILAVCELYGGWMTFAPEWLTGCPSLTTENPVYLWLYLVFFNGIWVVVPLWVLYKAWQEIGEFAPMDSPQITNHDVDYNPADYAPYGDDRSAYSYSVEPLHVRIPSQSSNRPSMDNSLPYPPKPDAPMADDDLYVAPLNLTRPMSMRSSTPSSSGRGMVSQYYDPSTRRISTFNFSTEPPPIFRPYREEAPPTCGSPGYDPSLMMSSDDGILEAAQSLRRAMQGLGTDEKALITILSTKNPIEIDEIRRKYRSEFNRDLVKDIRSETHGKLEGVISNLASGPLLQDVYRLRDAFGSNNEDILIDVLINRFNPDIEAIQSKFRELFLHETVSYHVKKMAALSSTGRELLKTLLEAQKADEDSTVDEVYILQDVQTIYDAMVLPAQSIFQRTALCEVFTRRSNTQICAIQLAYDLKNNTHLEEQICKTYEFENFTRKAFLAILKQARDPVGYTAKGLIDTMEGRGTSHWMLIDRLLRLHWMENWSDQHGKTFGKEVLRRFRHKYTSSLKRYIEAETLINGHYKAALLAIIPPPEKTMPGKTKILDYRLRKVGLASRILP